MTRTNAINTLCINHMEDRSLLETMSNEQLIEQLDYYGESHDKIIDDRMKIKVNLQTEIEFNIDHLPTSNDDAITMINLLLTKANITNHSITHFDIYDADDTKYQTGIDMDDHFKRTWYKPVCPRGYDDCVCDPAYIKANHSKWYHDLYGDVSPEKAILVENGCMQRYVEDPDEEYYCYDDEDK